MRPDTHRHFLALELSPGASANDIRGAYRKLIQKWHPDRFAAGSLMQTTAEDQTKELNEAYDWLYKKRHYRKFLAATDRPKARPVARPVETEDPPSEAEVKPPGPAADPRPPLRPSLSARLFSWTRRQWRWTAVAAGCAGSAYLIFLFGSPLAKLWKSDSPVPPANATVVAASPPGAGTSAGAPSAPPKGQPVRVTAREPVAAPRPMASLTLSAPPERSALAAMTSHPAGGSRELGAGAPAPSASSVHAWRQAGLPAATAIGLATEAPAAQARAAAERDRRLDAAEAELQTFDIGDSANRVRDLQGPPDEAIPEAMRYGSSIVYFEKGRVSSWINGLPRLRISPFSSIDLLDGIDAFAVGSTRGEVFRIQGAPDGVFADHYVYGANAVYFENDRVVRWIETYGHLRTRLALEPLFLGPARADPEGPRRGAWRPSGILRDF